MAVVWLRQSSHGKVVGAQWRLIMSKTTKEPLNTVFNFPNRCFVSLYKVCQLNLLRKDLESFCLSHRARLGGVTWPSSLPVRL